MDGRGRRTRLVGRDAELAVVRQALDQAAGQGRGTALFVCGEAGIGKSRLAREAAIEASARGLRVVTGRAAGGSPTPFRAITELVASGLRQLGGTEVAALDPYRPALARLVPIAGVQPSPDTSLAVMAESVLQLCSAVGGLVVVEDLQWADPETLGVVEYLADNVGGMAVVMLATVRNDETAPAATLARALGARGAGDVVSLHRLSPSDTAALAAACLDAGTGDMLPQAFVDHLEASAEGLPLLVEAVVDAAVAEGTVTRGRDGWEMRGLPREAGPPPRFADIVGARLDRLPPGPRAVTCAAAVFGRAFPWELVAAVTGVDDDTVLAALRLAVAHGLVMSEGAGFAFRHALTAQAVLDGLLPPERASLSRRAAEAVSWAHPDLEGPWRVVAADLHLGGGNVAEAAALLLAAGRDALARGGVAGAAVLLRRAVALAGRGERLLVPARLALLEALAAGGDWEGAEAVAEDIWTEITGEAAAVDAHLLLARAHLGARPAATARHLRDARAAAGSDEVARARIDALAALAVLESLEPNRAERAEGLARRAVVVAEVAGLHEVACEALEVIGRCARVRDLEAAEEAFAQELRIASDYGLGLWRVRALNELGTIAWLRRGDPAGVQRAHDAALRSGAVLLAAGYAVNLAVFHALLGHYDQSLEISRSCEATARRLGADELAAVAVVCQAMVAGHRGRRRDMEEQLSRATSTLPGATLPGDMEVVSWGLCRSLAALVDEDRPGALAAFGHADQAMRAAPALMGDAYSGMWLVVRLVEGLAGPEDLNEVERHAPGTILHTMTGGVARAIVAGRDGRGPEAEAALGQARTADQCPLVWNLCLRLAAEAALADGWGDPAAWLLEVEAWSEAEGLVAVANACEGLLRRAGVTRGRRDRSHGPLPAALRRAGVTRREADVLRLLGARLTNREIADRLYLSARTVEKHVASLMTKLGARSRRELGTPTDMDG